MKTVYKYIFNSLPFTITNGASVLYCWEEITDISCNTVVPVYSQKLKQKRLLLLGSNMLKIISKNINSFKRVLLYYIV